ncbi:MAG TPA: hypothetical protein VM425_01120 [Myxococcota bacterium]|nr:hypothetical protein [Myxococcota bacterium]
MRKNFCRFWLLLLAVLVLPRIALAQASGDVTEGELKVDHGQVNWSDHTITATGSGAPNLKAPNVAVARLGAERVAKLDALRNIMEVLKGVRVDSEITVESEMVTSSKMRSKIQGVIRNFKVLKTKYYSDGGVDLVVQVSLDGQLASTFVKPGSKAADLPAQGQAKNTGLVIDARGLKAVPALSPKILDEDGKVVYSAEYLSQEALESTGVVSYFRNIKAAKKDDRVAPNALVIKALKLGDGSKTNIVLSNADAARFRDPAANLKYLASGKVVLVID